MSGSSNFPTALDDDTSLHDVIDGVTSIIQDHHNNPKEAIKAIEEKIGIYSTSAPTTLDYRLGNPTGGHRHDGASGQGPPLTARYFRGFDRLGSLPSGPSLGFPIMLGRTVQVEHVSAILRRAPSGATTALDINAGPTSLWQASQGLRPIFPAGATVYGNSAPNLVTVASGVPLVVDVDTVGSNEPGQDISITFTFRE